MMTRKIILALTAATVAVPALACGPEPLQSRAWLYEGEGIYSELDYICDARDGKKLITVVKPSANVASYTRIVERDGLKRSKDHWTTLGEADAGMMQRRYTLNGSDGKQRGHVHTISPGAMHNPYNIAFPIVSSVEFDGERSECRYNKDAIFTGVLADRTLMVTRDAKGDLHLLTWMTHSPGKAPEDIEGGELLPSKDGAQVYRFGQGHTTITIKAPAKPDPIGAVVTVESDSGEKLTPMVRAYRTVVG